MHDSYKQKTNCPLQLCCFTMKSEKIFNENQAGKAKPPPLMQQRYTVIIKFPSQQHASVYPSVERTFTTYKNMHYRMHLWVNELSRVQLSEFILIHARGMPFHTRETFLLHLQTYSKVKCVKLEPWDFCCSMSTRFSKKWRSRKTSRWTHSHIRLFTATLLSAIYPARLLYSCHLKHQGLMQQVAWKKKSSLDVKKHIWVSEH